MTERETLKLALEALRLCTNVGMIPMYLQANQTAITAIKEALAQPEQEPVAWWNQSKDSVSTDPVHRHNSDCQPLYTAPQPCSTCEALARAVMMDQTGRDA